VALHACSEINLPVRQKSLRGLYCSGRNQCTVTADISNAWSPWWRFTPFIFFSCLVVMHFADERSDYSMRVTDKIDGFPDNNTSQTRAILAALSKPLTLIQGPPGSYFVLQFFSAHG